WYVNRDTVTVIPDTVKAIEDWLFTGRTWIESLQIPGSVEEIGEKAFAGCTSLKEIRFDGTTKQWAAVKKNRNWNNLVPAGFVTCTDGVAILPMFVIENGILTSCKDDMKSVVIPAGITEIGESAFAGCTSLTSVTIPSGVTKIGKRAFWGCTSLASVSIPEGMKEIGRSAFSSCTSLTSVAIPDSVEEIGEKAFSGCNISELTHPCLTIHDGLVIEDDRLLYCASQAAGITIPEGVREIIGWGDLIIDYESIVSVSIPVSITKIGTMAFEGCTSLKKICFAGTKDQWTAVEKGEDWNESVPARSVTCTDGEVGL
ncbi:MAG: leucine-rich repeat domain-containing protein, partial [Treponema sp.]|nr:leucine-rich repeat domain-containing protein [Treponema sp.]